MRIGGKLRALACALGLAAAGGAPAHADCSLAQVGTFPVSSEGGRMVVQADVDGKTVEMALDTGSPFTVISATAARLLGLHVHNTESGLSVGGAPVTRIADIGELHFGHFTLRNVSAVVTDATPDDGKLGRDVLGDHDVEIDLAHNAVRLLRTSGCSDAQMVYWGGTAFAEAPLQGYVSFLDDYRTVLGLNGHDVLAVLDTGAPSTIVSAAAAKSAGVTPGASDGQGQPSGLSGLFRTVTLGDETVKNARLGVTDLGRYGNSNGDYVSSALRDGGLSYGLVGDDFFRSHRVLISPIHHKVFFTYSGGPIFLPAGTPSAPK